MAEVALGGAKVAHIGPSMSAQRRTSRTIMYAIMFFLLVLFGFPLY